RNVPASGRYQIVMSQGGHCEGEDPAIQLEWYDTWLKGVATNMDKTAMPIHVHEQVSNKWYNTSHYPVVPTYTEYFLDGSEALTATGPWEAGQETVAWIPLPFIPQSQTDKVQYDPAVFKDGGTLAGPIGVSVYASSTTRTLELIATVQEVAADGTATPLSSGA